jgi:hypothetical protein
LKRRRNRPEDSPETDPDESEAHSSLTEETLSRVAEQIQEIVDAAERKAADVREQAEAEAEAHVKRRMEEADRAAAAREAAVAPAIEQTRAAMSRVRERLTELEAQLSGAAKGVREALGEIEESTALLNEPIAKESENGDRAPKAPTGRFSAAAREEAEGDGTEAEPTTLHRAIQMARAGSSREEIGEMLRGEFGVDDPTLILDEALGPE